MCLRLPCESLSAEHSGSGQSRQLAFKPLREAGNAKRPQAGVHSLRVFVFECDLGAGTPVRPSDEIVHAIELAITLLHLGSANCPPQNTRRKANCINRGVVIVPRYLPNCAAP